MEKAELSEAISCLHVCLLPALIEHSALADYGIDVSLIELAFVEVGPSVIRPIPPIVTVRFQSKNRSSSPHALAHRWLVAKPWSLS
ncbi:MAG: hypothetical protein PGN34_04760 [Methylobacterium frigidaeris]